MPAPPPFWRAILLGAVLIPPSLYYGNYAYVVVQALEWGQTSLQRGAVFMLFAIVLANLLFRKVARRAGLTAGEMLIIYSMIAVSVCVSGFGMLEFLINILPAGSYYATPANHYDRFLHFVPAFLVPHDPQAIKSFYLGRTDMYQGYILRDWAMPTLVWSLFLTGMCWVTVCLSALLRRQWVDDEKLSFPLVYVPLEMARGGAGETPFWRSRAMWAGFLLAGILESVDNLNYFFPAVPYLPIKPTTMHLEKNFAAAPWNSIGVFTLSFYPFAIGLAFLLSLEISFSCWFFYLISKLENVAAAALGLSQGGGRAAGMAQWPYLGEQGVGAFLALGVFLLWRARRTLVQAFRSTFNRDLAVQTDDPASPLSPRAALWGGLLGMGLLTAFGSVIGLPLWVSLTFWVVYLLLLIVITRIVAEAGAGWVWGPYGDPVHTMIMDASGSSAVGPQGLTTFGYLSWFDSEFRDSPMPQQLMGLKLSGETHVLRRQMLWAFLIAAALSSVSGFWAYLHMYYEFGAASAKVRPALQGVGTGTLNQIDHWLKTPKLVDHGALGAMAVGALIVIGLASLRQMLVGWPFHPIGYVLAGTASMEYMWCPFLIGWAIKALTLRYGGIRVYRLVLPFFLGLILGDYVVPMFWGLGGMLIHTQVYMAFPH